MTSIRRALLCLAPILALVLLGACDSTAPSGDVYALATINGEPLPGPYPDPHFSQVLEVTEGGITLHANGTFESWWRIRCQSDLPQGSECEVTNDLEEMSGTWSPGSITFFGGSTATFEADFEETRVVIHVVTPPSMGFSSPPFVLEFRR
jgi:hypothetical protein